jgi:TPR repeat protein
MFSKELQGLLARENTMKTFLIAVTLLFSANSFADFESAEAVYDKGDYGTAFQEMRVLAEQGHAKAQYYVGAMFLVGNGVAQDSIMGFMWTQISALNGSPQDAATAPILIDCISWSTPRE